VTSERAWIGYLAILTGREPLALCDVCGGGLAMLHIHHADGVTVRWCSECRNRNEPEPGLAYKRTWWLRILKWMARL
jgi:hypothetical protein